MPFVLPSSLIDTEELALVLAFGKLSTLEASAVLGRTVHRTEAPCERVAALRVDPSAALRVPELAGIHKCVPLVAVTGGESPDLENLVELLVMNLDEKSNFSVSGYDMASQDYEDIVRSLLDRLRAVGLRKVRLVRPKGNELRAEQVISRNALDVVAFPYHDGFGLGPTTWVPDSAAMRFRASGKPIPRPDVSLSPRLAQVLLNLAGLSKGQTVLDPFCGSGTILAEAYIKSIRCLGFDKSMGMVKAARQNLRWVAGGAGDEGYDVRRGDARQLSRTLRGTKVDAVVTEPILLPRLDARPSVATATELVGEAGEVYSKALAAMTELLNPDGRIVVVVPIIQTIEGEEVILLLNGRKLGLSLFQPGPSGFEYPVRLSFESTRRVKRAVYVFESRS